MIDEVPKKEKNRYFWITLWKQVKDEIREVAGWALECLWNDWCKYKN